MIQWKWTKMMWAQSNSPSWNMLYYVLGWVLLPLGQTTDMSHVTGNSTNTILPPIPPSYHTSPWFLCTLVTPISPVTMETPRPCTIRKTWTESGWESKIICERKREWHINRIVINQSDVIEVEKANKKRQRCQFLPKHKCIKGEYDIRIYFTQVTAVVSSITNNTLNNKVNNKNNKWITHKILVPRCSTEGYLKKEYKKITH